MTDRPPDPGDATDARPIVDRPPATPRWVKVFGIIAIVVVLLIVARIFVGGGEHGPGRHMSSGEAGGQAPYSKVAEVRAPPEGGHG